MKKAVVDANAIIGFLQRGDFVLNKARETFDELIIPSEIIFEAVYVLESVYKKDRETIINWIINLLGEPKLSYDRRLILDTLLCYRDNPKLSVVDCYILIFAREQKIDVVTSDKNLLRKLK